MAEDDDQKQLLEDLFGVDSDGDDDLPAAPAATQQEEEVYTSAGYIKISRLPQPTSTTQLYHVKLPNTFGIEPKVFDPTTFQETVQEEGSKRVSDSTIRWRTGDTGSESNARIIEWEDGTLSLNIGEEYFDIRTLPWDDLQYLFVRHTDASAIANTAALRQKLAFMPASTKQKSHLKLTSRLAKEHQKNKAIKALSAMQNPVQAKRMIEQAEEEKIRAAKKAQAETVKVSRRYDEAPREMTEDYLEEGAEYESSGGEEEEETQTKPTKYKRFAAASDSEDERQRERAILDAKRNALPAKRAAHSAPAEDDELRRSSKKGKKIIEDDEE